MKKLILYIVHHIILRFILRALIGVSFRNTDYLRKYPQFILVGNHNSHLDTVSILSSLPFGILQKVHPVAAMDYFGNTPVRAWLTRLLVNAILIPRKRPENPGDPDPVKMMEEALEKGESIILFPEGSRGIPELMTPFRKGIGYLLRKYSEIPFIPVYMSGLGRCLPKGDNLLLPLKGEVVFGEPQFVTGSTVEEIVSEVELAVRNLGEAESFHPNWDRITTVA